MAPTQTNSSTFATLDPGPHLYVRPVGGLETFMLDWSVVPKMPEELHGDILQKGQLLRPSPKQDLCTDLFAKKHNKTRGFGQSTPLIKVVNCPKPLN